MSNLTQNTWNCKCGAMNAAYRQSCGKCNILYSTGELTTNLDATWEAFGDFDMDDFLYNRDDR
jgi:hypothetical protein